MSRIRPVIKREFTEAVGSKAFIIGTILGPLLIFGMFGLQFLVLAKSGGGEHRIALLDASQRGKLELTARTCPVFRSLAEDVAKEVEFVYPD